MALTDSSRRPGALSRATAGLCALLAAAPFTLARAALQQTAPPAPSASSSGPVPPSAYAQMRWRLIGPFRGGWATMAAGVPREPNTF